MEEHISAVCLSLDEWNKILSRLLKQSLPPETPVMVAIDFANEKVLVTVELEN